MAINILHQRIRRDVADRIHSGEWPPGSKIPSEAKLMEEYGCARMTVNRAMAQLVADGLIVRRRKAGSFVAQPRMEATFTDIQDLSEEAQRAGKKYRFELVEREVRPVPKNVADKFEIKAGLNAVELSGRHFFDDRVVALEHRLIFTDEVPQASHQNFEKTSPGGWLLRIIPWTEAEHRLSAVNSSAGEAQLLGADGRMPCLQLDRKTWKGTSLITCVRMLFPGDSFSIHGKFRHSSGG